MLKMENTCNFTINERWAGVNPGGVYYGFIVEYIFENRRFEGVLAPSMIGPGDWVLFPMRCVTITNHPKVPLNGPLFEMDA